MRGQGDLLSGRYLVQDELGAGGMGTVYRAVDLRTGAEVAVKLPHPFLARDQSYIERLRREAQIAASLHSPRVAIVTDFAEHEGLPYLVMEYVPGENVAERLRREGAMPVGEALHVALEVARALDAAHQRGIIHRDLKPENIRIDRGDVKVLDFGIARLDGQSALTAAGMLVGSPEYLAPERADGHADIRSDIYALGVVLYEMLAGAPPFGGPTPWTVLRRHAVEPPPPLPEGLPPVVYPIVERCLAKRPEDRYQTPRELVTALQAAVRSVEHAPTEAVPRPPAPQPDNAEPTVLLPRRTARANTPPGAGTSPGTPPEQPATVDLPASLVNGPAAPTRSTLPPSPPVTAPSPPPARTPRGKPPIWAFAAAAVSLLVVVGIVAVMLSRGSDSTPETTEATAVPPPAEPQAQTTAGAATPGPVTLDFVSPAEGAQVTAPVRIEVRTSGVVLKRPTEQDPNARHLHYFLDTDPAAVLGPGQPVPTGIQNIIHTPDIVQTLNLQPGQHTVWVVMTDNDHLPLRPNVQAKITFTVTGTPARSADQAPMVYQSLEEGKWRLFTMDGTGRNPRRLSPGSANDVEPAWSPDGSKIVFASDRDGGRFHLFVMNADGSGVQQLTRDNSQERSPVWSPDGSSIAFHSDRDGGRFHIFVMPAGGGDARQLTRGDANDFSPTWSPDGRRLAFARQQGGEQHIWAIDAAGGDPRQLTTAKRAHIEPAWSPDGGQIAFSAFENNRWNIFVMNADGSSVQKVTNGDPQDRHPAWSPDGREIVFAPGREGQLQIYALPRDSTQARPLTEGLAHNQHPSWPRK